MKPSRQVHPVIAALTILLALVAVYFGMHRVREQRENVSIAQQYVDQIMPKLKEDSRFQGVRVGAYTGGGGCFLVVGDVDCSADEESLRILINSFKIPVPTQWDLRIEPSDPSQASSEQPVKSSDEKEKRVTANNPNHRKLEILHIVH